MLGTGLKNVRTAMLKTKETELKIVQTSTLKIKGIGLKRRLAKGQPLACGSTRCHII